MHPTTGVLLKIGAGLIGTTLCLILFWKFWFLRDPERMIPSGDLIVSPADGRIMSIEKFDISKGETTSIPKGMFGAIETSLTEVGSAGYIISIFMSPLDVHINRSPIAGTILSQTHTPGTFHPANRWPESFLENEKNEFLIQGEHITVKVIQIAGFLARRIQSLVQTGHHVTKGERIGLINLGSQCVLILPQEHIVLNLRIGDRVSAGSSIIATIEP
ncbi:phosphatidylserine decarboxylase family protein [Candidatus Peregrinibacteria bacterium]|nr:phosphatidylserine decarboxylase family protein [Candidatus Peregrinibacteria bacterium]